MDGNRVKNNLDIIHFSPRLHINPERWKELAVHAAMGEEDHHLPSPIRERAGGWISRVLGGRETKVEPGRVADSMHITSSHDPRPTLPFPVPLTS
jgi:hypothetical protein